MKSRQMKDVILELGPLAMYFYEINSGRCILKPEDRYPTDVCLGGRRETIDEICERFGLNIVEGIKEPE